MMTEKRKIAALRLIQEMLDPRARPTLRDVGLTLGEAHELESDELILLGDTRGGEDLDRYIVAGLEPKAINFLILKKYSP
jgi:hypothetical protein